MPLPNGWIKLRRGLLEHLPKMAQAHPQAATVYVCLHLLADSREGGLVEATTEALAESCGISKTAAYRALEALIPAYIERVKKGKYLILRYEQEGGSADSEVPPAEHPGWKKGPKGGQEVPSAEHPGQQEVPPAEHPDPEVPSAEHPEGSEVPPAELPDQTEGSGSSASGTSLLITKKDKCKDYGEASSEAGPRQDDAQDWPEGMKPEAIAAHRPWGDDMQLAFEIIWELYPKPNRSKMPEKMAFLKAMQRLGDKWNVWKKGSAPNRYRLAMLLAEGRDPSGRYRSKWQWPLTKRQYLPSWEKFVNPWDWKMEWESLVAQQRLEAKLQGDPDLQPKEGWSAGGWD